jgi:hypothetical protein
MALAHGARMALAPGRQAILWPIHGRPKIFVLIAHGFRFLMVFGTMVGPKLPWTVEAITAYGRRGEQSQSCCQTPPHSSKINCTLEHYTHITRLNIIRLNTHKVAVRRLTPIHNVRRFGSGCALRWTQPSVLIQIPS